MTGGPVCVSGDTLGTGEDITGISGQRVESEKSTRGSCEVEIGEGTRWSRVSWGTEVSV